MASKKIPTRQKILDAAEIVFAEHGYAAATVREICNVAEVNIASINYHFGGKEELYKELCLNLFRTVFDRYPISRDFPEGTPQEDRLFFFIRGMLQRLVEDEQKIEKTSKVQILTRELAGPTSMLDSIVEEFIRPTSGILLEIISQILGPLATEREVRRCVLSIVGQCMYYGLTRPILVRLNFMDLDEPGILEELATHITQFSIKGMAGIRQGLEVEPKQVQA